MYGILIPDQLLSFGLFMNKLFEYGKSRFRGLPSPNLYTLFIKSQGLSLYESLIIFEKIFEDFINASDIVNSPYPPFFESFISLS